MPGHRVLPNFACVAVLAAAVAGCSGATDMFKSDAGWFQKPLTLVRADGSDATVSKNFDLGPRGPVAPEDFVTADGQCAAPMMAAQPGDPSGQPPVDAGLQPVGGGIALGMTECDAVRRAGTPSNVNIGGGETGERQVVLTYLSGPWPGIYTFSSGRLKDISAAPVQAKAATKPAARKKAASAKPRALKPAPVVQ